MGLTALQRIAVGRAVQDMRNVGVAERRVALVRHQVSFRDIGDIVRLLVLCEEVVIGLVLGRAKMFRDRLIPFIGIGEDRVDIEDDAAKLEQPVLDDLADLEFRAAPVDGEMRIAVLTIGFVGRRLDHGGFFPPAAACRLARFGPADEQGGYALEYAASMAHCDPM